MISLFLILLILEHGTGIIMIRILIFYDGNADLFVYAFVFASLAS
jgi:hypothetical protein